MEKQGLWPAVLRYVRNIGITIACIFVLAGLSCLPLGAWRTVYHLGNRVMLIGIAVVLVGAGSLTGRMSAAADPLEQMPYGRSSGQRVKQRVADSMSSYRVAIAGGVAVFVGDLIRRAGLSV